MKKGFTLIELLAVITILAIIATIATPIVLNVINDAKKSTTLRSSEYYLDAVEQSLSRSMLNGNKNINGIHTIMENGNMCIGRVENNDCIGKEIEVQVKGQKPSAGNVTVKDGKIDYANINYETDRIVKNYDEGVVKVQEKICTLISDVDDSKTITAGDKYSCEVKAGTSFNFYVLNTPTDNNINLIMDRNVCEDGTAVTEDKDCTPEWISKLDYSDDNYYYAVEKGPVTAMNYLYRATKNWYNVPNIIVDYEDENNVSEDDGYQYGYGSIITTNNLTQITKKDGTIVNVLTGEEGYTNLKARMPYKSEVKNYDETNGYLYDYLSVSCIDEDSKTVDCEGAYIKLGVFEEGINHIGRNGYGYWILASDYVDGILVNYEGYISSLPVNNPTGVRPVITITTNNILS